MADLNSQPMSIQSLYGLHNENKLYVNRRYQRKLVWTALEKQKLIESILKKYPIPAILIAEREEESGSFEIIDGLQRLQAIISFIETAFSTLDERYFDVTQFPTAKARSEDGHFSFDAQTQKLTPKDISSFLDYTLAISVMRNASNEEIDDVFDRINTYGKRLSDQERRQSGVQNDFSSLVRNLACSLRGDESEDILLLNSMPSISIDLPKSQHGYDVRSDEVFWVKKGILRSTDLRDSMDEQCIADISASIIGGQIIDRSKMALDTIFQRGSAESDRILTALDVYGANKFMDEFKYCIDQILKTCGQEKLSTIVFKKTTNNAFPSVFAIIMMAYYELIILEKKMVSDFDSLRASLTDIADRIQTGQKATSPTERRKNVDTVKGVIQSSFVKSDSTVKIYNNHSSCDIETVIRRSEIEVSGYELKQGILPLINSGRAIDSSVVEKILKTICAIANNGPGNVGKIIIGVADTDSDASRIESIDRISPKKIGKKYVVGVSREAVALGWSTEEYFTYWKESLKNSALSEPLKSSVLSHMDYNDFFGLGVLVFTIPKQAELSYFNDEVYCRNGDSTELVDGHKKVADLAKRF
ncbi:DUF262 domain-containing protein [Pontiellaceae bacterium B1224]|nr:DUF262 domain-containing protein [Pontiellaceae bacterium B1224]